MKKFVLIGLFASLLAIGSQAQDGASQIFERAKAAHGGAALESLITYRDTGTISSFDKGQVVAKLEYRQVYDFATSKVRIELLQNKKPIQIFQTLPNEAWSWTSQSGVVRLPAAQAKPIRNSLFEGLFAFRAKSSELTDLKVTSAVKIGNLDGTAIEFKLNGIPSYPVIAADGTIIGAQTTVNNNVVQANSSDYRTVAGVRLSFLTTTSVAGQPAFELKVDTAEVNPALTDADFAKPQ